MEEARLSDEERLEMLSLLKGSQNSPKTQNKGIFETKTNSGETSETEITGNESSAQLLEMVLKRKAKMDKEAKDNMDEARKEIVNNQRLDMINEFRF